MAPSLLTFWFLLHSTFCSLIQRDAAIEVFRKSGLPEPVLLSIFALADDDHDGVLAPKEFCVAFHLIVCLR